MAVKMTLLRGGLLAAVLALVSVPQALSYPLG
jgi:hypothetical protein